MSKTYKLIRVDDIKNKNKKFKTCRTKNNLHNKTILIKTISF